MFLCAEGAKPLSLFVFLPPSLSFLLSLSFSLFPSLSSPLPFILSLSASQPSPLPLFYHFITSVPVSPPLPLPLSISLESLYSSLSGLPALSFIPVFFPPSTAPVG